MSELLINGIPTWFETVGSGPENVIALHGGLSNSQVFRTSSHR